MSNAKDINRQNGCTTAKPSEGQHSRYNHTAGAVAATGSSASSQLTRPGPLAHPLPPKPGNPLQPEPSQSQHRETTQVVRRRQEIPSAFLKLPADIIALIVPNLSPLDLIYLARVNISVRRVLMHRSASPMWRACIETAGLPVCPPKLSEPKYVSILYLPSCSACGGEDQPKRDIYLLVRLCLSCSKKLLIDQRTLEPAELQAVVFASVRSKKVKHSLKREVDDARTRLNELRSSGNENALEAWKQTRKADLQIRKERGDRINRVFEAAHVNRQNECRREWRKQIERRLLALGYGVKEEDLPRKRQGTWRGFFNRVDPFTETKWDQLQRHLIDFLEAETKERPGDGQKRCRSSRDSALRERFKYLRRAIDTLPDRPDGLSAVRRAAIMVDWLPLPGYEDTLEWPTIQTLLEADISVREAVDGFNKHREEITQMALDWGKRIKRGWADVLREGRKLEGLVVDPPRPRLSIDEAGADTDPFKGIDTDTSLLLRADSLFQPQNRPELYSYEELARHMDSNFGRGRSTLDRIKYLTFASTASKIAQALLMSLNHSDGSSVEFNSGPCRWFRCGRCHSSKMDWHEMIRHYIHMAENWEKAQARLPKLSKLGIAYNNVHDLESVNPKRLLTQLSAQEAMDVDTRLEKLEKMLCIDQVAEELRESSLPTNQAALTGGGERIDHPGNEDEDEDVEDVNWEQEDWDQVFFRCTLCRKGGLDEDMLMFTTIPDMFDHLRNVHNVSDPQRSIVLGNLNSMMRSPYFGLDLWD